jgi:hypothetical protein
MGAALPGSGSGRSLGLGFTKVALRLIGGADLADAIVDLTGLSRKSIKGLTAKAVRELQQNAGHEYAQLETASVSPAAEDLLNEAFSKTAAALRPQIQQTILVRALMGSDELARLVTSAVSPARFDGWSEDELNYFHELVRRVAELACQWYRDDPTARAAATAAGVGQSLHNDAEQLAMLGDIRDRVDQLADGIAAPSTAADESGAFTLIAVT